MFVNELAIKVNENIQQNSSLNPGYKWENIKLTISSFASRVASEKNKINRVNQEIGEIS